MSFRHAYRTLASENHDIYHTSYNVERENKEAMSRHQMLCNQNTHWEAYCNSVDLHRQSALGNPESFSLPPEEKYYKQCLACPLTELSRSQMPLIILPLRIHLIRSKELGCSLDLNQESMKQIVAEMNKYWKQCGIQFQVSSDDNTTDGILNHDLDQLIPESIRKESRHFIVHGLTRGPDGRMRNRSKRKDLYLNTLLHPLNFRQNRFTYDVYFFDMTGNGSQGVCISREYRVVIMGERSTKGYAEPTKRPHACLAKTLAHELGHALGLGHPWDKATKTCLVFRDGTKQCMERHEDDNLMKGGEDRSGGGGHYLESWQICLARDEAIAFLERAN